MEQIEEARVFLEIPKEKVWLMPAGDSREELIKMYPISIEKAAEMGYNWTGRDHIIAYDTKRGV
jgi:7-carboxy-7-deazaguanine synthase